MLVLYYTCGLVSMEHAYADQDCDVGATRKAPRYHSTWHGLRTWPPGKKPRFVVVVVSKLWRFHFPRPLRLQPWWLLVAAVVFCRCLPHHNARALSRRQTAFGIPGPSLLNHFLNGPYVVSLLNSLASDATVLSHNVHDRDAYHDLAFGLRIMLRGTTISTL